MFKAFRARRAAERQWCIENGLRPGRYIVDPTSADPLPPEVFGRLDIDEVTTAVDRLNTRHSDADMVGSPLALTAYERALLTSMGGSALAARVECDFGPGIVADNNLLARPNNDRQLEGL